MEKIKVGIIGCGGMGNTHANVISQIDNVEIFAASDLSEEKLARFNEKFKPAYSFADYRKLIEMSEIDAVLVCLPTYLHKEPVVIAAKNGKHIFCEKPIALTLEDADVMINECEKNRVVFTIGFVRRFDNEWGKFRDIVIEGKLGRPVVWRNGIILSAPPAPWYMDKDKGGGPFIDGCVHNYDFARYIFGDLKRVAGMPAKINKKVTALDTGTFIVEFKSGDQHVVSWSWALPGKCDSGRRINDAFGPCGIVNFQESFDKKFLPPDFNSDKEGAFLLDNGNNIQVIRYEKNKMFIEQMVHFIECVKGNAKPCVTGLDGYEALKIGLSILHLD